MQLHHNRPNDSYCEEDQERPCHFWWAKLRKGRLETDHGPVLCRDFLGDTLVWIAKEQPPTQIYGWKFHGTVEKKYTSLVLDDFGQIEENIFLLNVIEEKIGVKMTQVEVTEDGSHVWIKGDKFWMLTTVHFSWYTTMLRYLTYGIKFQSIDDFENYHTNGWMSNAFPTFKKLPYVLHKLKITQVSGTKNVAELGRTMHEYNGWYANTKDGYESKFTEYGVQLNALLK